MLVRFAEAHLVAQLIMSEQVINQLLATTDNNKGPYVRAFVNCELIFKVAIPCQ